MAAGETAALVADATPHLTAALAACGTAVLSKVSDDAADVTLGTGRGLRQRVFGRGKEGEPLPVLLAEVVNAPDDVDAPGALRLSIRRELEADADMLADVRGILAPARTKKHAPVIHSGRDTYYSGRDMIISRSAD